jgi:hypothetical protein
MALLLSASEIRDIVAWLAVQKEKPKRKQARPAPVVVKP